MRLQAENDAALGKFAKRYPDVAKDPGLAEAGMSVLRDEIATDLKAAGIAEKAIAPARRDTGRMVTHTPRHVLAAPALRALRTRPGLRNGGRHAQRGCDPPG